MNYRELLNKSRELYCGAYRVDNFISEEETDICINIYNELPNFEAATIADAVRKDYLMHSQDDSRVRDIFKHKLEQLFPDYTVEVDGGNFTSWNQPVKIHTDGYQSKYKDKQHFVDKQEVLGFIVLVPLTVSSDTTTRETVFFDQTHFGQNISPADVTDSKWHPHIDNFTFKEFNGDYDKLKHNGRDRLYGFSVEKTLEWTPGCAIVWHRAQFHCAADFDNDQRLHLVFFLNLKDDR